VVFQFAGAVTGKGALEPGGLMVQVKSEGLGWLKQTSSVADEMVRKEQFWLSQLTDIPVPSLSVMALPEVAGCAAHKVLESQVAVLVLLFCVVEGEPPPPQLANSAVRVSKRPVQRVDRMQEFSEWGVPTPGLGGRCRSGRPVVVPLCTDCQNRQIIQPIGDVLRGRVW